MNGLPDYYSYRAETPESRKTWGMTPDWAVTWGGQVSRCAHEQAVVGEQIRARDPAFGLKLAAQDWLKEEAILHGEIDRKET